jgi:hypothetical protein
MKTKVSKVASVESGKHIVKHIVKQTYRETYRGINISANIFVVKHIVLPWYSSKSGLIHKHIVKHIVVSPD